MDQVNATRVEEVWRRLREARAMLSLPSEQLVMDYLDHAIFELREIERRELGAATTR